MVANAVTPRALIVDDERMIRSALQRLVGALGCEVVLAEDGVDAIGKLRGAAYDLIITDLRMPRADGFAVLSEARKQHPGTPVLVLTGHGSVAECVTAMRAGAANFLTKPFHVVELEAAVRRLLGERSPDREATEKGAPARRGRPQVALLGESPRLTYVLELVGRVAETDATVLITGETGTGKEVVAHLIHGASRRVGSPFVAVNCGAIPEGLIESELFGHARGAFTGATDKRVGKFAQADGGTLFLDEIGELPLDLQVKLLRVLQEHEITPVGESAAQPVDLRVVAATHRNLEAMVEEGSFREDLFYRLNVVPIDLPPLRERTEDIPILARYFLDAANRRTGRRLELSEDAAGLLQVYSWPGNVRELENLIERLVIVVRGDAVTVEDLPSRMRRAAPTGLAARALAPTALSPEGIDLPRTLAEIERRLIDEALRMAGGNKNRAAALLRINRTTLVEKLKRQS
ncbi:MAG TPA: sigma-54 dependent transcriptional regulator [Polyangia bacterium]|nr:sigma-54 dependent transcriptional regulator [Polyangia bacterium]